MRGRTLPIRQAAGLALSASPVAAAALWAAGAGVIWWFLALRIATPDEAGRLLAVLGIATLSAEFASLGIGHVLLRYLPTAGASASTMARTAFALVVCATCIVATAVVVSPVRISPVVTPTLVYPLVLAAIALGTASYALTDSLLLSLGHHRWILARSVGTGLARVGLLWFVAGAPETTWWLLGMAYSLPALLATGITVALLRRFLLRDVGLKALLTRREVARFAPYGLRSYSANLGGAVPVNALPPLIAWQLGPSSAAEYGVAWLVASTLMLVPGAVSLTNLATVSRGEKPRESMVSRGISVVLAVQLPAVVAALLIAPSVFSMLGDEYSDVGLGVLAPLLGGVVCLSLTSQLYSRARLTEGGIRVVASGQWLQATLIVALSALLMPRIGITGVSVAWLVGAGTALLFILIAAPLLWRGDVLDRQNTD